MPTFICHDCGAIDNTALTHYWSRKLGGQPALCSKCLTGKWHDQFPRQHWSELGIGRVLELQKLGKVI